jgi:hypothetical protein
MTFAYTTAGVIQLYQDAMDGITGITSAKNLLEDANQSGCPFDHDDDWVANWKERTGCDFKPDCDTDAVSDGLNDPDGTGPMSAGPDNCPLKPNNGQAAGTWTALATHAMTVTETATLMRPNSM